MSKFDVYFACYCLTLNPIRCRQLVCLRSICCLSRPHPPRVTSRRSLPLLPLTHLHRQHRQHQELSSTLPFRTERTSIASRARGREARAWKTSGQSASSSSRTSRCAGRTSCSRTRTSRCAGRTSRSKPSTIRWDNFLVCH